MSRWSSECSVLRYNVASEKLDVTSRRHASMVVLRRKVPMVRLACSAGENDSGPCSRADGAAIFLEWQTASISQFRLAPEAAGSSGEVA